MEIQSTVSVRNIVAGNNPRTYFNPSEMAEMESSIRAQGLLQPILVRPVDSVRYEIVAGERRFRSFKAVFGEDAEIPVLSREMTDAQAEAAAATENMIRTDMSPVEEAQAAARVLGRTQGNRDETAKILGWSPSMLDKRLALMHASDLVRKSLEEGKILLGHAELLAVCRKEAQDTALTQLLNQPKLMTVNDLKSFMEKAALHLDSAIFDKTECLQCHHNSGNQGALFAETISDGRCTNKLCFEGKTDSELNLRAEKLKDEYQVVKIVRAGENLTVKPLLANGEKGVGEDQAKACQTCKNFGAVVSALPDTLGKVYKQMCLDVPCNEKMVKARVDTEKQLAKAAAGVTKTDPVKAGGNATTVAKPPTPVKPVKTEPSGPLKEYREKLWRMIFRRVVGKMSVPDNRTVFLAIVLARPSVLDCHALGSAVEKTIPGIGNSHNVKTNLAKLREITQEQLGAALQQVAANVSSGPNGLGIDDVTAILSTYEVAIEKHWKVDKDFLELLTKNEIDAVCGEIGIKTAMGADYAKLRNAGKEDYIKAILAIPDFEYSGRVPKLMHW